MHLELGGWPANLGDFSVSDLGAAGLEGQPCVTMLSFYLHSRDSQLGPENCIANTLIH